MSLRDPHDFDLWRSVSDVNLNGTFIVMWLAAALTVGNNPAGEAGELGVIVNTLSVAAGDGQKS